MPEVSRAGESLYPRMAPSVLAVVSLTVLGLLPLEVRGFVDRNPDIDLKTPDLASKYGYPLESHTVVTTDGYILELHRIPYGRGARGDEGRGGRMPILVQHGLSGSSADWIVTGPGMALAYLLADEGYDVWLGNNRGNLYSRKHTYLSPRNRTFWDFSYHELGVYDLPATIDHVLKVTRRKRVLYVGHSQGMTQLLVMTSILPEYNSKIALAAGLAPAAFLGNLRGPLVQLATGTYLFLWFGETFGWPEISSRPPWSKLVTSLFCNKDTPTQFLCNNNHILIAGLNSEELDVKNFSVILGHVPAGASSKQLVHFGLGYMNPGTFRAFDYVDKDKNMRLYGSTTPPDYPLNRITAPIALFGSDDDWLASSEDVDLLSSKLKNVVLYYKVPANNFYHYDFLWGKRSKELVFDPLLRLLEDYR